MSQSPQDPENSRQPEQPFGQQGEPTQAFGQQGEQPTQAYPQGPPPGAPGAGGDQSWQAGAGQQGGYSQQGGYGQQDPRAQGGYPSYGSQPHRSEYGQAGGYGDPDGPDRRRSSKAPIIAVIVVAALVVAGLIFGGIALFGGGGDPEPVVIEDTEDPTDEPPAEGDEGTVDEEGATDEEGAETDEGTNDIDDPAGEPGGLLYDLLTSQVEVVDGDLAQWTIDDPGWENYEVEDADPIEAYIADFTSDEDDSLQMWAIRMDDADAAVEYGEALVEERGSSDESGPVWEIEDDEEIEDDLAYGQFHLWEDGDDIEVLWWDDTGIVRHVSGPAEATWDFYLYAGV